MARVRQAMAVVLASVLVFAGVTGLSAGTSGATSASWPENFTAEPSQPDNTFDTKSDLSVNCPEGIAATPGSDPADKVLNDALNSTGWNQPGGTIHYIYNDNPNDDSVNFVLQDCIVVYPAATFVASDFNADGQLVVAKSGVAKSGTQIDGASLSGIRNSTGQIFFSWTAPADLTGGDWVCNYARDISTGHGGGGNRKVSPTCYQVERSVTPALPTHNATTTCGAQDTYTIPTTTGVTYKVGGVTKAAGTYILPATTTVAITAEPNAGYFFPPATPASWSFTGSAIEVCLTDATPAAPTFTSTTVCGVQDSYIIPSTDGVIYKVNNVTTSAGTYNLAANDVVTITAVASTGYQIANGAQTTWGPFTGSTVEVCDTPVTPAAPTYTLVTACGVLDSYTIPSTTGVTYRVNGDDKAAGTYDLPTGTTITITAVALEGSVIADGAQTTWGPFTGSAAPACDIPVTPAAPTHAVITTCGVEDTYTIPSTTGVTYKVGDVITAAGIYDLPAGETVTITAVANSGYVFATGADTDWDSFTGSDVEVCDRVVTPAVPTYTATTACGVLDSYTIPSVEGVVYKVNNVNTASGTYNVPTGTVVTITAAALEGSVIAEGAPTSWGPFTGSAVETCGGTVIVETTTTTVPPTTTTTVPPTTTTEAPTTTIVGNVGGVVIETTTTAPNLAFTPDPAPAAETARAAGPTLAFTGSDTLNTLLAALVLLVFGVVLIATGRRRDTA